MKTVLFTGKSRHEIILGKNVKMCEYVCVCGEVKWCRSGWKTRLKSCGCLRGGVHITHGHARNKKSKAYTAWLSMKKRCRKDNADSYTVSRYSDRGIEVCKEWQSSFETFLLDMGEPPVIDFRVHLLDRIDNDKGYNKGNCRWVDDHTSSLNTSVTLMYEHNGLNYPVRKWLKLLGVGYHLFCMRYYQKGWTIPEALGFVSITGKWGAIKKPSELNWLAEKSINFDKTTNLAIYGI